LSSVDPFVAGNIFFFKKQVLKLWGEKGSNELMQLRKSDYGQIQQA
jgi:hypothetical protein